MVNQYQTRKLLSLDDTTDFIQKLLEHTLTSFRSTLHKEKAEDGICQKTPHLINQPIVQ
jgi:50S ribosomal subunit-associated GTPase HflX